VPYLTVETGGFECMMRSGGGEDDGELEEEYGRIFVVLKIVGTLGTRDQKTLEQFCDDASKRGLLPTSSCF
jgi:hypothetical protein